MSVPAVVSICHNLQHAKAAKFFALAHVGNMKRDFPADFLTFFLRFILRCHHFFTVSAHALPYAAPAAAALQCDIQLTFAAYNYELP